MAITKSTADVEMLIARLRATKQLKIILNNNGVCETWY